MNHERWLVSYADFITLMFAFFVVMFASSQVDKRKIAVMAATFDSYAHRGQMRPAWPQADEVAEKAGVAAQALTMAELQPSKDKLESVLLSEIVAGKVEISLQPRGLVLSLKESAFFAPGQDAISPECLPIVSKVAGALRQIPGQIRLEGHTDNVPIRSQRFPSNWYLSTARAVAVLKLLNHEMGLPAERLAVAGYGQFHPLESNSSDAGRAKNRRVDLVILTQEAAAMTPG